MANHLGRQLPKRVCSMVLFVAAERQEPRSHYRRLLDRRLGSLLEVALQPANRDPRERRGFLRAIRTVSSSASARLTR
jgi:hypothetical protein